MTVVLKALPALLVLAGCSGATTVAPKSAGLGRCTLLVTNDSEAHFDGDKITDGPPIRYLGPIARVAAEKQRLAKRREGVLLISAGDVLQGRYMQRTDGDRKRAARESWQVYDKAGYDLAVLGNHEFDAGPAVVAYAIGGLHKLRIVVSNLADGQGTALDNVGGKLFARTVVRSCGGLKIGFLGLLTPSTRTISDFGDTRFQDPSKPLYPAARRAVQTLQKQGVDAIIALTHLGIDAEIQLARKVKGIDVIVGGHSHTLLRRAKPVGETMVVQAGARFSHLGYVQLHGKPGGGIDRARMSWSVRAITADMAPDPVIAAHVDKLRTAYPAEVVIGKRAQKWSLRGAGRRVYGAAVARSVAEWLGNHGQKPHATVLNTGGLRTAKTYPAGPVTNLEVAAIHPFRNRIVVAEMNGKQLRALAEHACTRSHRGRGLRVLLHGIQWACDGTRPSITYIHKNGKVVGIKRRGARVRFLKIGGEDVTEDGNYRIATNNYMARGGSGYYVFTTVPRKCPDGTAFAATRCKSAPTLADIVKDAVKRGTFNP